MDYVLDTSVISQLAPGRSPDISDFAGWITTNQDSCYLTAMMVTELERGHAKLVRLNHTAKAAARSEWLEAVVSAYGRRVLPFDLEAARLAGRMIEEAVGRGHTPSLPDVLIGATAKRHAMVVLTRNIRDFIALDTQCQDPFET
jgi:predicted nucleic acid-binding protein